MAKVPHWKFDANPLIDPPDFYPKAHEAQIRLQKGYCFSINGGIQDRPPIGYHKDQSNLIAAGTFSEAWPYRYSGPILMRQLASHGKSAE